MHRQDIATFEVMKLTRVVVHVGAHKTATTYIQKLFSDNSSNLREIGVRYEPLPKELRNQLGSFGRKQNFSSIGTLSVALADILNPSPDHRCVFCSWEGFLGPTFENGALYNLADKFSLLLAQAAALLTVPMEIVYYVRRQDEFIASAYVQAVKEGSALSFQQYYEQLDKAHILWSRPIDALRSAGFHVTVAPYEEIRNSTDVFLQPILERVQLQRSDIKGDPGLVNSSYTAKALAVARAINGAVELEATEIRQVRRYIERVFAEGAKPSVLTQEIRSQIAEACADQNSMLALGENFRDEIGKFYAFDDSDLTNN